MTEAIWQSETDTLLICDDGRGCDIWHIEVDRHLTGEQASRIRDHFISVLTGTSPRVLVTGPGITVTRYETSTYDSFDLEHCAA